MTATDVAGTRAFFGPRASGWEDRFPDDGPAYARAVAELAPPAGGTALDAGRALPALRDHLGGTGILIAVDLTVEMLAEATRRGRRSVAALLLGDVTRLPLDTATVDAIFAAGLLPHLPDPAAGLAELARVTRPGGRLALFHPVGRASLAQRRGRELEPDDIRAAPNIRPALARAGWRCETVDDTAERYLTLAVRLPGQDASPSARR